MIGVLLSDPAALTALGAAVAEPPYKAPPKAPVLFVKPRNTYAASGAEVCIPAGIDTLEVAASVGLVIGRPACQVEAAQAMLYVAGLTLVVDLSVPHESFYRPSVRFKALDGSCLLGPAPVAGLDPDGLTIEVHVGGQVAHRFDARRFVRSAARLLADVTSFMTLQPGDILMLGTAHGAPRLRAGQTFEVRAAGLGPVMGRLAAEPA